MAYVKRNVFLKINQPIFEDCILRYAAIWAGSLFSVFERNVLPLYFHGGRIVIT
jgi:hypothetical protein